MNLEGKSKSLFPHSLEMSGGTLANVNRWRGQAGLSAISQDELAASLSEVAIDDNRGQIVDILPERRRPAGS